jgi:hypothetical protein
MYRYRRTDGKLVEMTIGYFPQMHNANFLYNFGLFVLEIFMVIIVDQIVIEKLSIIACLVLVLYPSINLDYTMKCNSS